MLDKDGVEAHVKGATAQDFVDGVWRLAKKLGDGQAADKISKRLSAELEMTGPSDVHDAEDAVTQVARGLGLQWPPPSKQASVTKRIPKYYATSIVGNDGNLYIDDDFKKYAKSVGLDPEKMEFPRDEDENDDNSGALELEKFKEVLRKQGFKVDDVEFFFHPSQWEVNEDDIEGTHSEGTILGQDTVLVPRTSAAKRYGEESHD